MKTWRRILWWSAKITGALLTPLIVLCGLLIFVWEALEAYDD